MKGVYVLQLENGIWYIGKSKRVTNRFKAHARKYNDESITATHEVDEVRSVFEVVTGMPRLVSTEEFIAGRMAERYGLDSIEGGTMSGERKTRIRKRKPSAGFIRAIRGTDWAWLDDGVSVSEDDSEWRLADVSELSVIFKREYAKEQSI